ncbi:C2H2 finger domain protein [Eremomyces bilateralis CBS 781.70]|uniref:C2H2 finger domain protein n=1 Tax=Eremomyces bilateralis CBS 781.70 TaxID=1392243 RepID=A0A6G1FV36_9PEZI|nr:C2H2 finger domain protein [Eremomyces bilateralis CBS 781.70]KAF1809568.1 C2H2 finger domain protein [Eremomyces bilateralis CBS 781.70]
MRRRTVDDSWSDGDSTSSQSDDSSTYRTNLNDTPDTSGCDSDADLNRESAWLLEGNEHPPEYYNQLLDNFDDSEYTKEDYSDGTTVLLDRSEAQWNQYCAYTGKDPKKMYQAISINVLHNFFHWLLSQRRGKEGRRLRGTKLASSLGTYWKIYRLTYERATGDKINGPTTRGMHKVLRKLAKRHGLKKGAREKPCMYVEDLKEALRTNLCAVEKKYSHGRIRIGVQLFMQIGGFTANRPGALLNLCYRHIRVTLLRDPEGGPNRILLEFSFEFTKSFLGIKDINTFPIPEIIYDPSLIYSPHVLLLGLIFDDQAFAAPSLTSPDQLSMLDIEPGQNQLLLPLRSDLDDVPIFRKAIKTPEGWEISKDEPLEYSTIRYAMKRVGELTGFKLLLRPYALRYGAGKAFNENGNVSEALQNLMMQHGDPRTFLKHYLHRRVTVDAAAIVRRVQPQDAVMQAACNMSRWIDPNRPWGLTAEQADSVNQTPLIRSLLQDRDRLKRRYSPKHIKYIEHNKRIISEKQRLRASLLADIQEKYEKEGPVRAIEQQLSGVKISQKPIVASYFTTKTLPEQKRLIEALILAPPGNTLEEEFRRRNEAIIAVTEYCKIEEGDTPKSQTRPRGQMKRLSIKNEDEDRSAAPVKLIEKEIEAAMLSVFKDKRPTICFLCLGNVALPLAIRVYSFSTSSDLGKHFRRKHLSNITDGERIDCRVCKMSLSCKMHLQSHAKKIHGTVS